MEEQREEIGYEENILLQDLATNYELADTEFFQSRFKRFCNSLINKYPDKEIVFAINSFQDNQPITERLEYDGNLFTDKNHGGKYHVNSVSTLVLQALKIEGREVQLEII